MQPKVSKEDAKDQKGAVLKELEEHFSLNVKSIWVSREVEKVTE